MSVTSSLGVVFETASFGGPHRYIINLLEELEDNYDVTIIFPESQDRYFYNKLIKFNVRIIEFPLSCLGGGIVNSASYFIFMFLNFLGIKKYFGSSRFDIMYIMGGSCCFLSVLLGLWCSKKLCWNLNDSYMPPIMRPFFWFFSRFVKSYVLTNKRTYELYKNMIPIDSRYRIIESPVSEIDFSINRKLKNKSERVNLVAVGNISPVKGYKDLIDILGLLTASCDVQFKLTIIGKVFPRQQSYYGQICDYAVKNNVNVTILNDIVDVFEVFSNHDIFVMTSISESSPLALYEALSYGMPFVVFDFTDLSKLEGLDGFIVKGRDKSLFSEKIVTLCEENKWYSANNQNYVKRFHSPAMIASDHQKFFESLE